MEQYAERIHVQFSGRVERAAPGLSVRPETFPLLTTRVHVPPVPLNLVARPQLISTLDRGIRQRKLTLLLAPAGSGKTTLLSAWRAAPAGNSLPAAWLSLDERDNEPGHFLAYLLLALQGIQGADEFQRCAPDVSSEPLSEEALIRLLNAIASSITYDFVLVLDNYQAIAHPAIHRALAFVLQYAPRSMHLVIASRVQPPFSLIRLRAQGQLWEMTGQDLRFDAEETALFLNTTMGLQLASHEAEELHQQSEGWITGLQLAACTVQTQQRAGSLAQILVGQRRYVFDYLASEVFARQTPEMQELLLQTATLERFTPALALAVAGQEQEPLLCGLLERTDLFLLRLDEEGEEWYRYHHLFRAFLLSMLRARRSGAVPPLSLPRARLLELSAATVHDQGKGKENRPLLLTTMQRYLSSGEGTSSRQAEPARPLESLSAREVDVLHLVMQGNSNQEIAQQLSLALCTVKWHVKNIYGKLQVHNRVQLVRHAQQFGL